ncbi:hypothetical protein HYPSUDRAFT_143067 [Hypholoma sublateritium FD-334 SS-4]|uniref:Cytochrome b561 domain-containing protein n=1 Tax=Hypholoma sublateritium (strain FD-334 SS-4) TaxID=945553 RepID=A0A0D2KZQ9_HYPSF|nr:hypothetical protein HYPSUDRAFT_143067 [Hypholoma sublateritium FD-334 SS-4]
MWQNNGDVILSQRKASSEVMPTTDSSPPRTASALQAQSTISTTTPSLAYTIPSNTDVTQPIIYAYGTTDPNSADPTATLIQHLDYGTLTLNLQANVISSNGSSSGNTTTPTASDGSGGSLSIPLAQYEKLIIAHAILCTIGFLLLLPAGVLLARYMRTFVSNWFQGHWIVQFGIAGIVIIVGIALGIASVSQAHAVHFDDDHKKWGIGLLVLYLVQCGLGAFIHFVKKADRKRRPAQNYLHAVLGLAIIGLALFQVHSGYDHEWVVSTGREALPKSVNVVFWVWVVLLPVSYAVGLSFLPKQFRQERAKVNISNGDDDRSHFNLGQTTYGYQKAVQ